jgi:hypothetical protein
MIASKRASNEFGGAFDELGMDSKVMQYISSSGAVDDFEYSFVA